MILLRYSYHKLITNFPQSKGLAQVILRLFIVISFELEYFLRLQLAIYSMLHLENFYKQQVKIMFRSEASVLF